MVATARFTVSTRAWAVSSSTSTLIRRGTPADISWRSRPFFWLCKSECIYVALWWVYIVLSYRLILLLRVIVISKWEKSEMKCGDLCSFNKYYASCIGPYIWLYAIWIPWKFRIKIMISQCLNRTMWWFSNCVKILKITGKVCKLLPCVWYREIVKEVMYKSLVYFNLPYKKS